MRIFIAKHQTSGLKMTFKFDANTVRVLEFEGDWKYEQIQKILPKIPCTLEIILADIKKQKPESKWLFAELTDISFESFYTKYPRKVGPKELSKKSYEKLSEADKMSAILYIEDLKRLKMDGTSFPYPATYLNKKYWR